MPSTRSWSRAVADVSQAFRQRELWGHLGWQDIKQRYRRSLIGPLWITISMGVTALALGILYSSLFHVDVAVFLPYITVGFIIWGFISGCVLEGSDAFIANEGLIRHLPAPITVYVLRTVWRQVLFFAHNLVIYFVVLGIFWSKLSEPYQMIDADFAALQPGFSWSVLLAIPAFVLLAVNGIWVALLFGIISTRFRDIPPVVNSFIQLAMYMTPIMWAPDLLRSRTGGEDAAWRTIIAEGNPIYHYLEILRAPLLGHQQFWQHWAVVGILTVVGWALALIALRNYRARVSYWV